jgi:hypothetical protein
MVGGRLRENGSRSCKTKTSGTTKRMSIAKVISRRHTIDGYELDGVEGYGGGRECQV